MNRTAGAAHPAKPTHRRPTRQNDMITMIAINYKGTVRTLPPETAMRIRRAAEELGKSVEETVKILLREARSVGNNIFLPVR